MASLAVTITLVSVAAAISLWLAVDAVEKKCPSATYWLLFIMAGVAIITGFIAADSLQDKPALVEKP